MIRIREVGYFSPAGLNCGRREGLICSKDSTFCPLPSNLSHKTCTDFETFSSRVRAIGVRQNENQWGDEFGLTNMSIKWDEEPPGVIFQQTLSPASISGGMMVSVIGEAATGATAVALMLYLTPSIANVLVNVTRPILAALW